MKVKFGMGLLMGCLAICLQGCANVPDNIQSNKDVVKEEENQEEVLKFDSVGNVIHTANEAKNEKYDNLYFNVEFEINQPKEIGVLEMKQEDDFCKNQDEMLKEFIGELNPEVELETDLYEPGVVYNDPEILNCLSLGENGFLFWVKEDEYEWIGVLNQEYDKYKKIDTIILYSEYEEQSFEYNGTTFSLNDMVEAAQEQADEFTTKYDSMKWYPSSVTILQSESGEYFFKFQYTKSYNEMYFLYNDYRKILDTVKDEYVCVMQPIMILNSSKEPILIDNFPGVIECVDTKKVYDEIVTLQYAAQQLSDKLSSYRSYNVYDINLEYRLVQTSGYEVEDPSFNFSNWWDGNEYEARPCWTFYLSNDLEHMTFAMVDCETGEIEFVSGE